MIDTVALKRRVLELAMTGKLSKYQLGDDKIDDVLNRITKEKEDLLIKRNGRKDNNIKDRAEGENDELPENWTWIRFGETGLFKKGPFGSALTKSMFVPKSEDTVKVYEQQHAINKNHTLGTYYITRDYFEDSMSGFEVQPGDVIVSCAGTIGETYVMPEDIEQGIINQALMRVSLIPSIYDKFFLYYFEYGLKKTAQEESNGSAIKNIPPFDIMKNWIFPITSIQEQKRIVENIEEMYQWIDKIGILQTQYSSDLEVLKSKIIDAGIQGKLTEQLPEDGTAGELLEQIAEEKNLLIKENKIKVTKALPEITEDEIPFEIPNNWIWVRLDNIARKVFAGGDKPEDFQKEKDVVHPYPVVANGVKDDGILGYSAKYTAESDTVTVAGRGTIGFSVYRDYKYCPIVRLIVVEPSDGINPRYLKYVFQGMPAGSVGSSIPQLTVPMLKPKLIPLPPANEQNRIVARIDEVLEQIEMI